MNKDRKPTDAEVENQGRQGQIEQINNFIEEALEMNSVSSLPNLDEVVLNYIDIKDKVDYLSNSIKLEDYIDNFKEKWSLVYDKFEMLARAVRIKKQLDGNKRDYEEDASTDCDTNEDIELDIIERKHAWRKEKQKQTDEFFKDLYSFIFTSPSMIAILVSVALIVIGAISFGGIVGQYLLFSGVAVVAIGINYWMGLLSDELVVEFIHYITAIIIKIALFIFAVIGLINATYVACVIPFSVAIILTCVIDAILASDFVYGDEDVDACIGFICIGITVLFLTFALAIMFSTLVAAICTVIGFVLCLVYYFIYLQYTIDYDVALLIIYIILQIMCFIIMLFI